jgi:hypothetical protein
MDAYIEIRKGRQSQSLAFEKFGSGFIAVTLALMIEMRGATFHRSWSRRPGCAAQLDQPQHKSSSAKIAARCGRSRL